MDIPLLALAVSAANFFLNWGIGFYVHLVSKNKVTNDRITKLEENFDTRMNGQGERIARLEAQIGAAPTHEDLGQIYEKINQNAQDTRQLVGEVRGMNDTLRLILNQIAQKGMQ